MTRSHLPNYRLISRLERVPQAASAIVTLVGCLVLLGWMLDIPTLKSVFPGLAAMKVNTAVGFLLSGVSLWLLHTERANQRKHRIGLVCAFTVAIIGLLTLSEYLFGWNLGIDQLLFHEVPTLVGTSHPGRMSPTAAVNFLLNGSALVLVSRNNRRSYVLAQFLTLTAGLVSLLALVGYAYEVEALYQISFYTSIALHTVLTFIVLCVGILFTRPDLGLMRIIISNSTGGFIARRLLLAAIAIPFLLGWLIFQGLRAGLYSPAFGLSLLVMASIVVFAILIWQNARTVDRIDSERSQATDALEKSESQLRLITDAVPVLISYVDSQQRYRFNNKRYEDWFGHPLSEVSGKHLKEVLGEAAYESVRPHLEAVLSGQEVSFERILPYKDGGNRYIRASYIPDMGDRGEVKGYVALVQDITEQKRSELALQASEERYRELFENANDVVYTLDLAGNLTSLNKAGERITGYISDELLHKKIGPIVVPEYLETMLQMFDRKVNGQKLTTYELEIIAKDGHRVLLEVSSRLIYQEGNPVGMQGIARDITERKRSEDEIRRLNVDLQRRVTELQTLLDVVPIGIAVAHDPQCLHITTNPYFAQLLGVAPDSNSSTSVPSADKLPYKILRNGEEFPPSELPMQVAAAQGREVKGAECDVLREDGTLIHLLIDAAPLFDERGSVRGCLGAFVDITEIKQTEESLRQLAKQVEEQAKALDAILCASVDHIYMFDRAGRYTYVSAGGAQVLGFKPLDLVGKTWRDIGVPAEIMEGVDAQREQVMSTGSPVQGETDFSTASLVRHYEYIMAPLLDRDKSVNGVVVVSRDTTDRKRTLEALRESQEQLQLAFDAANLGMWDFNVQTEKIIWSGEHERLFGMEPGTFRGTLEEFIDRVHPDDREWVFEAIARSMLDRTEFDYEYRVIWSDGSVHWVAAKGRFFYDENGQPQRMTGAVMDITSRKTVEEALRISEIRFRTLVEQSPLSKQILAPDGRTLMVNRAWEELWGVTLDEIGEYNMLEDEQLVVLGVMPYIKKGFAGVATAIPPVMYDPNQTIPNRTIHSNPQRWVRAFIYPVKDEAGSIREVVLIHEDITAEKLAEEAVRISEAKFRRLAESNIIGVIIVDYSGNIFDANDAFLQMVGYTRSDLVAGKIDWREMTPPEYVIIDEQAIAQISQTGACTPFEKEYIRSDGSRVPILLGAALLEGSQDRSICFVLDLSDRKRAEQALRDSEKRFRRLVESNIFGVAFGDFSGGIQYANDYFLKMVGYERSDLLAGNNVRWDKMTPPEFLHLDARGAEELRKHGFTTPFEKEYIRKDGSRVPILIGGALLQEPYEEQQEIICFYLDLTDRKRAELALQETNQTLEALIQACPLAITVFNIDDAHVKLWNPAAEKIFGWSEQQAIGRFLPSVPDEKQDEFLANLDAVRQGKTLTGVEARREKKNGIPIDIAIWAAPLRDAKGNISCLSIIADITERKKLEAERAQLLAREQEARKEAEAANRAKDEFLATLSHELRTPLNPMLGWTQLLRTRKFDERTTARAFEAIERNTKLLSQLIEDVLDVSRIITGKLRLNVRPVKLVRVIEAAIDTVRPAAEAKEIRIESILDPSVGLVLGDANRLQQVVWNLISNAVKFTPKGGSVWVQLDEIDSRAQILVSDTGKGISPDFLPYVFERFRQADGSSTRSHGGLGLGLAIVRHLVELQGGTVRAQSPGVGLGATFTVYLPLLEGSRVTERLPGAGEQGSRGAWEQGSTGSQENVSLSLTGLRVLVVDDEADARELLVTAIGQYGAEVTAVASAGEALEAIARFQPNVLVSDIGMPEEDGYALIRKVRALDGDRGGRIPAVALTAYARAEDRTQAIEAGFQLHVSKPVDPGELVVAIASVVGAARTT